jgi:hypothetical protein
VRALALLVVLSGCGDRAPAKVDLGKSEVAKADLALDRDKDGIADAVDQCPDEPENKNGWQDEDGCPDPDHPPAPAKK